MVVELSSVRASVNTFKHEYLRRPNSTKFNLLAGNKDIHNISSEFEIRPDRTKDYGVSCPLASGKIQIDL